MAEKKNNSSSTKTTKTTKKTKTARSGERDFVKFCAFWGLAIAAVLFIVSGILSLIGLSGSGVWAIKTLNLISQIALGFAICIPAWRYVSHKKMAWKVVFIVVCTIYVVGIIFGMWL